jgi:hypothetical protein
MPSPKIINSQGAQFGRTKRFLNIKLNFQSLINNKVALGSASFYIISGRQYLFVRVIKKTSKKQTLKYDRRTKILSEKTFRKNNQSTLETANE